MGTITRAVGNSFTTSGVIKSSAINNDTLSNVSSLPAAISTGSMILLSTQTASSSASIEFTSGITSTYKEYMFIFNNIHPSVDAAELGFNFSTDGGSNYNVTKTSLFFEAEHDEADTATNFYYRTADDLAQSTSNQNFLRVVGADNDQAGCGFLHLYNPSDTTYVKHYIGTNSTVAGNDYARNSFVGGYGNTTSAINAVKFVFNSGNIDDGTIQMFGIK